MNSSAAGSSRAVRASIAPTTRLDGDPTLVLEPDDIRAAAPDGRVLLGSAIRRPDGVVVREVVVDGWRLEVELELERRAGLRERASHARTAAGASDPVELRAVIPGRIVAVAVIVGDDVVVGQHLLVIEAMKMQNELPAPRPGTIERVAIAVGQNVEVGDLLLVIT
jgi:biotin carboxyl carrier protein